jgi:hypothetical protein
MEIFGRGKIPLGKIKKIYSGYNPDRKERWISRQKTLMEKKKCTMQE